MGILEKALTPIILSFAHKYIKNLQAADVAMWGKSNSAKISLSLIISSAFLC